MSMKNYTEFWEAMKDDTMRKELSMYLTKKKPETKADEVQLIVEYAAAKGIL